MEAYFDKVIVNRQQAASSQAAEIARRLRVGDLNIEDTLDQARKAITQVKGVLRLKADYQALGIPLLEFEPVGEAPRDQWYIPEKYEGSKEGEWSSDQLLAAAASLSQRDEPSFDEAPNVSPLLRPSFEFTRNPKGALLYQDYDIIVVNKPVKVGTDGRRGNPGVVQIMRDLYQSPLINYGERLDVDMSGVLVLARTPRVASNLYDQFGDIEGLDVHRYYLALMQGDLGSKGKPIEIKAPVELDEGDEYEGEKIDVGVEFLPLAVLEDGRGSVTTFTQIHLNFGRPQWVRAMAAGLEAPIVGDDLHIHGSASSRLMLHAAHTEFLHPVTAQPMGVTAPIPEDFRGVMSTYNVKEVFPANAKSSILGKKAELANALR